MKDVLRIVFQGLFYLLVAALFCLTATLTLRLMDRLLPGDEITKWFSLAVFDVGALIWFGIFTKAATGMAQRAVALSLFCLDLLGVGVVITAEILMGGQSLVQVPAGIASVAVYGTIAWVFVNLVAGYMYHLADPATQLAIREQNAHDKVINLTYDKLEQRMDGISEAVANDKSLDLQRRALRAMGVDPDHYLAPGKVTIEGKLEEPKPAASMPSVTSVGNGKVHTYNKDTEQLPTLESNPTPRRKSKG